MVGPILTLLAAFATSTGLQDQPDTAEVSPHVSVFARLELAVQGGPRGLIQTDVDDDGADELIVLTELPGRIHIWSGLKPELTTLSKPFVADVPDFCLGPELLPDNTLVLASRIDQAVLLYPLTADHIRSTENPTRSFVPQEIRIALGAIPRALTVGDSSWGGTRIAVVTEAPELLIINGDRIESRTPLVDSLPTAVAFAQGGVIVASQGSPSLVFYAAEASPTAGSTVSFQPGAELKLAGIPRDIAILDLDHDGDEELVCLLGARTAYVLGLEREGGLTPWFSNGAELPNAVEWQTGSLPIDLTTFDLTGDGYLELIATHLSDQVISVLGGFEIEGPRLTNALHGGAGPWRSEIGDLDGDGNPDLAVANPQGSAISLFFGSPSHSSFGGFQGAPHHMAVPVPHSMTSGDFDGDGRDDVALLSAWDNSIGMLFGAPGATASFQPVETIVAPPESDELATGDLDGDGLDDLVMLVQTPLGTKLLALTFGPSGRRQLHSSATDCREGAGILPLDFDGDGRAEVLVSDAAGHELIVYGLSVTGELSAIARLALDDAPGELTPIYGASAGSAEIQLRGLAVGLDGVDGSGIGLISVAPAEQAKSELALGLAPFSIVGTLPTPRPVQDIIGADMNGDGFTDIAALMQGATDNQAGGVLIMLSPNGTSGSSWRQLPPLLTGPKSYHLVAKDLNGDQASELFVSSQYAYRIDTWVGIPGRAPAPSWRLGAHRGCMDMAFVDINGDGAIELIVSNNHSSDVSVLQLGD